jgi:transcriptional regulator with XRE-family HTH domain
MPNAIRLVHHLVLKFCLCSLWIGHLFSVDDALAVLIELREAAGLTQADAAERCGLRGRQSRKTLAAWELGQSTPRQRYRIPVALYLLRDLNLRADPDRFDAVYAILVDEWGWEPLEDAERAKVMRQAAEEPAASAVAPAVVSTVTSAEGKEYTEDYAENEQAEAVPPFGVTSWLTQQRMLTAATILILVVVLYVFYTRSPFPPTEPGPVTEPTTTATPTIIPTLTPSPTPTHTATALPTSTSTRGPNALENLDFEDGLAPGILWETRRVTMRSETEVGSIFEGAICLWKDERRRVFLYAKNWAHCQRVLKASVWLFGYVLPMQHPPKESWSSGLGAVRWR